MYSSLTETDVADAIHTALDLGINFIDTAPHYGRGVAETRLGVNLEGVPRKSFVISTKVGRLLLPVEGESDTQFFDADHNVTQVFDYSAEGVKRSLLESLERMGLDSVEMVLIHDPDDFADQALSEAYPELEKLRAQGIIKAIGIGMNQSAIPTRFVKETDIDLVLIAGRYSLLDQSAAEDLLPAALAKDVAIIVGGVFNSGILANPVEGSMNNYASASEEILGRAKQINEVLRDFNVTIAQAAMQFPLRHPAVKAILVGCRSGKEVRENVAAFNADIPEAAWQALADLQSEIV
ncbi:MAG: aldo/keto reductase [Actinobacteria bacterium]|nr:aldo/keto reductase [Actinomycetota bacterium]